MMGNNILSFYGSYSAKIACIWLSSWVLRRNAEVDLPLDRTARTVRWMAVAMGFGVGYYVHGQKWGYVRLAGFVFGLAFLCWPNFAHHLTNLFKRNKESPP
jgi:hypothetical protein